MNYKTNKQTKTEGVLTKPKSFFETRIKLIPKQGIDTATTTTEKYRPISLLNIHSNILNKTLVN